MSEESGWRFPLEGCTNQTLNMLVGTEVVVVIPGLHTFVYTGVLEKTEVAFAVHHAHNFYDPDAGKSTIMFRTVENIFISESCVVIVLPADMVCTTKERKAVWP